MALVEPVALAHSWPLWEQARHFELGHVFNCAITDLIPPIEVGTIGPHHAGCWECDLSNNSLVWSGGVYDIFGSSIGTMLLASTSKTQERRWNVCVRTLSSTGADLRST